MTECLEDTIKKIERNNRLMEAALNENNELVRQIKEKKDEDLISVRAASELFDVSPTWIYDLIKTGKIGQQRRGTMRVSKKEVKEYIGSLKPAYI